MAPAASVPILDLFAPAPARPREPDPSSATDRPLVRPEAEPSPFYRLRFLGVGSEGRLSILTEMDVPAANVSEAIRSAAHLDWPPLAVGFRLFDAAGREIFGWQSDKRG